MSQVVSFTDFTPPARYDAIAWEQVRVEEADSSSGSWALIDTITFDDVDDNPAIPKARNITTDAASDTPDLWYRLTFVDGNSDTAQPSRPIQNTARSTSFASADEFADRLGLTLTTEEQSRASALLAVAAGLIQDTAKQTISLVEDDELTVVGTTDERILLPERPVVSVASVTRGETVLTEGSDWYLDGNAIVRRTVLFTGVSMLDAPFLLGSGFGDPTVPLTIIYTHGYDEVPPLVKAICLEAVVRVWVNPGNVVQENIGDTGSIYGPYASAPRGLLLTDAEQQAIRRFFGRKARSITIGG